MSKKALGQQIEDLAATDQGPFPYEDCRYLLRTNPGEYEQLIPDLSSHFMTIAGYASNASQIEEWTEERIRLAREHLSNPFFENHPEYELLQRQISPEDTPHLADRLGLYEDLRQKILDLTR